jgi:outer membrane protein assembly factor BamB
MKGTGIHLVKIVLTLVTVIAITGTIACTKSTTTTTTATAGTAPTEVTQYAKDWPLPNKDYANTRATKDSSINSSNVSTLGVAWVHTVPTGTSTFGSISTTPIIMNNTVYIGDLGNNIFALDLATGQQKWQTVYNVANVGPSGAAVGYGKVFTSIGPYEFAALDANTGKEVWRTTLIDVAKNPSQGVNGIDMQPTVYDGLVYISTVPGNAGAFYAGGGMGTIYALEEQTGKIIWSFNTVQDTGLWGHPEINSGGGCWYSPAIDTQTGLSFFDIANPAPFPGQPKATGIAQNWPSGTSRPGPNLYTNSVLALDHSTGKLKWYNQVWPHDISDYDLQISPMLATANYGGVQQNVIIAAGKMGRVYCINRDTGALLWDVEVGTHNGNDESATWPSGTITVIPGIFGGVETPMAYADGVVYIAANNLAVDYTDGLTLKVHPFGENTGNMVAIDINTGHILWNVPLSSGAYGAATVVNDLVFTGTFDGVLHAFLRDTGKEVWTYKAPAGVNAWPAFSGDMMVWPIAGPGGPSSVIGFKLGSTSPGVAIASPVAGSALPVGDITVSAIVTNFNIMDKQGQAAISGEGHLHFYLDVDAPTTQGQPAIPSGGIWAHVAASSYTFTNVPAGTHTISVELVNNDHTPLNPAVVQKIIVTVDTNPRIQISQPTNGSIKKTGSLTIKVNVSNFNVVDKQGQAAVPGEGHIHFYMDVVPPNTPGQPAIPGSGVWAHVSDTSYTFDNVPVGIHTFYVQLVNNDHTPLSTNVTDSIQVYIINYTGGLGGQ